MRLFLSLLFLTLQFPSSPRDPLLFQKSAGTVLERKAYVACYDDQRKFTLWTCYLLTDSMLLATPCKRSNDFRPDPSVKNSAQLSDYKSSGYDRGHLVNSADMRFDEYCQSETFLLTNISPQQPAFNRGVWKNLETRTRKWAMDRKKLYVVTGGILKDSVAYIGNRLPVPSHFYKIIFDPVKYQAIAFVMENKTGNLPLKTYAVSIDYIEEETKIDFFAALEDSLENRMEALIDTSWFNF